MSIDVVEGGAIEATQAQVIKSRVEGREGTTILKIIDEGYQVTEKDVAEGLVLVELDSSAIVERIKAQETDVQAALANWMEYVKMREIRESANLSSIKDASVKAKFALMDFKKYLGEEAAQSILDDIGLSEETIDDDAGNAINASKSLFASSLMGAANSNAIEAGDGSIVGGLESPEDLFNSWGGADEKDLLPDIRDYDVDFSALTQEGNEQLLGDGDARQELRKLQDSVLIAEAEFALKKKTYEELCDWPIEASSRRMSCRTRKSISTKARTPWLPPKPRCSSSRPTISRKMPSSFCLTTSKPLCA